MIDFAAARRMMVDGQVRTSDVTDARLIAAMLDLPREAFLPPATASLAYLDLDLPMREGSGRRMLKPMVLAKLLQSAELGGGDSVLDIGCGSGYSAALIGRLAGRVVGLEEDGELAAMARRALAAGGAANVAIESGPLTEGFAAAAPYDVIIVEGAVETVPEALHGQLKDGGRLVCVLGRAPAGRAMLYRKVDGDVSGWPVFDAAAPLLPGFERKPEFVF